MNKESEKILNDFLKRVKDSLEYMPKSEIDERLNTIRIHVMDAIEDQKGKLPEVEIVKNTIKDLGIKVKAKRTIKNVILNLIGYGIIGIFIFFLDWIFIYPRFGLNASIPYFIIIFPAACGLEIWYFAIKPRLPDPRYNLIYAWIFYPILIIEMIFLEILEPFHLIIPLIYGMIFGIFTILLIVMPEELIEKKCHKCGEILPKKAKFCMMCGEELE